MISLTRIAAAAALTVVATGATLAADLPTRMAPPAPYVAPVPVFTWTGPYFGINAGYSFNNETKFNLTGATAADNGVGSSRPGSFKNNGDGFTAGGQVGYNYQLGGFAGGGIVIGVEADAAYLDSSRTGTYTGLSTAGLAANNSFRSGVDFLGTVRGRVGYAFNQFMVYGTGGLAYGDAFQKASLFTAGNPNELRYFGSHSEMQTGYAYGGGIEYAIPTTSFLNFFHSSAVTLKAEYLHYDLGNSTVAANNLIVNTGTSAYNVRTKTDGDLARVGLNYKF